MRYRTASLDQVGLMLDWAAEEGWNPGLGDAAAFHAADPQGFFVAEVEGQTVAAISVVNHSDSFAFLGLYLCRPVYRGRGIGYGLWQHALAHAGNRTIGLDGVPEQEANYARSGFALAGRTRRYRGPLPEVDAAPLAGAADGPAIALLDRQANGIDRPAFLAAWTAETGTRRTVVLRADAKVAGFATARLCREGCKVGPVIASRARDALDLAAGAAAALGQREAILDVPDDRTEFVSQLIKAGFTEDFATARMYRGPAPATGPALMSIASMELG